MGRPYTGARPPIGRRQPGLEHFAASVEYLTGGRLWNNGTLGVRPMRGHADRLSVHATGRAVDLSRRAMNDRRPGSDRAYMVGWIDALVEHADLFELELLVDYEPGPGGRSWKCDRAAWRDQARGTIAGAPGGDWIHVELSPRVAASPELVDQAFRTILAGLEPAPAPAPTPPRYPGRPVKRGSTGEAVRQVQARLAVTVDGRFGPVTERAVTAFQMTHGLVADGIVGPVTWHNLFG